MYLCKVILQNSIIQKLYALVLIFALLIMTFPKAFVLTNFYLNRGEYAALCINKDKPQMHCNGQCQMNKQLNQVDHQESQNPEKAIQSIPQVVLFVQQPGTYEFSDLQNIKKEYGIMPVPSLKSHPHHLFRPPTA